MKMIDKIDVDGEKGTNAKLEDIRKNNSMMEENKLKKDKDKGFCTKCIIY
jgi:hypothetical protein